MMMTLGERHIIVLIRLNVVQMTRSFLVNSRRGGTINT